MLFSARLRGMVSSMWLHWLGERLSSSFTSRRRFSGAQEAQWDMVRQVTACLSLTQRRDSGQHCLLTVWGTLTFQCGPGGVSLQVVLAQAGPCHAAELLQRWAVALAPQPCRAVAVLGDDGPEVASCGSEQSRGWAAAGEQGRQSSKGLWELGKGGKVGGTYRWCGWACWPRSAGKQRSSWGAPHLARALARPWHRHLE